MEVTPGYKSAKGLSIADLRRLCQSTAPNPPKETILGRFCRIFSVYFTYVLSFTPLTPNHISVIGASICLLSGAVYFLEDRSLWLLGPLFYFLSILLDGADGEISRLKKSGTKLGSEYVEPVTHDILYSVYFALIAVGLFSHTGDWRLLIAALVLVNAKLLSRLLEMRFWDVVYRGTDRERKDVQNAVAAERTFFVRQVVFWKNNLFGYPAILGPMLIATLAGRMDLFIYFYALGFASIYVVILAKQIRHFNRKAA